MKGFPNKYVPRSIQNIFDRLEAKNERDDKKSSKEELQNVFEVKIYESLNPYTKSKVAGKSSKSDTSLGQYHYYRARSLAGHHEHMLSPELATSEQQFEALRNSHFQAILKKDTDENLPLMGDIWNATYLGGNMINLNYFVRSEEVELKLDEDSLSGKFDGAEFLNTLGDVLIKATPGGRFIAEGLNYLDNFMNGRSQVPIKYKALSARADVARFKHYETFLQKLSETLAELGFTGELIVNSTRRSPSQQANAMLGSRYRKFGKDYFIQWFKDQYSDQIERELLPTLLKDYGSEEELKNAMASKIREMDERGIPTSPHMKSSALDLNSNKLTFKEGMTMVMALELLKTEGLIKYYKWETAGENEASLKRRKDEGVWDNNEHFHITLKVGEKSE